MILCLCDECAVSGAEKLTYGGHQKPYCDDCRHRFSSAEQAHHYRLSRVDVERSLRGQTALQPLVVKEGVVRFRENAIVRFLLNNGGVDLNQIRRNAELFTQEDIEQFYQLIGYSLGGYEELSLVSDEAAIAGWEKAGEKT